MKKKKLSAKVAGVRASIEYEPFALGDFKNLVSGSEGRRLELATVGKVIASPKPLTGEQIRWIRSVLGLDQKAFAELLGMSRATVIRYEAGGDAPRPSDFAIRFLAIARLAPEGLEVDLGSALRKPRAPHRRARAPRPAAASNG